MYYLKTEQSFDAAHFLKGYAGKCHNLHGHRWRVIVEIRSDKLRTDAQCRSMVVDFSDLKKSLKDICDFYDHSLIYETGSLKETTVPAWKKEVFCLNEVPSGRAGGVFPRHIYETMQQQGYNVSRVDVYETPNNCASYGG